MRYKIIKSREIFLVYEGDRILKSFYCYKEANDYVQRLEYIDLIKLMMSDY